MLVCICLACVAPDRSYEVPSIPKPLRERFCRVLGTVMLFLWAGSGLALVSNWGRDSFSPTRCARRISNHSCLIGVPIVSLLRYETTAYSRYISSTWSREARPFFDKQEIGRSMFPDVICMPLEEFAVTTSG